MNLKSEDLHKLVKLHGGDYTIKQIYENNKLVVTVYTWFDKDTKKKAQVVVNNIF